MGDILPLRPNETAETSVDLSASEAAATAFHERCFDRFRVRHVARGLTPTYTAKCLEAFRALLTWARKPVFEIQEQDYEAWCDYLANHQHARRSTQRTLQAHVRQVIKYLYKAADLQSESQQLFGQRIALFAHPDNSIVHNVEDETEGRRLPVTQDELDALWESFDTRIEKCLTDAPRKYRALCRDKVMLYVIYLYGLRASEVGQIMIDDWRPDPALPECGKYAYLCVRFGKGAKGSGKRARPIPTTDLSIVSLMDWYMQEIRPLYSQVAKPGFERHVFLSEQGKPITVGSIESRFALHLKAAGFPTCKYSPHSLRRAMVTHELICGSGTTFTQAKAGHQSPATTMIYGRVPLEHQMRSAARLARQRVDTLFKEGLS